MTDSTPNRDETATFREWATRAFGLKHQAPDEALKHQWRFLDVREGECLELQTLLPDIPLRGQGTDKFPECRFAFTRSLPETARLLGEASSFQRTGLYVILNRHHKAVYAKAEAGKWLPNKHATTDRDIESRRILVLDFDPEREGGVKGISATDAEQAEAVKAAYRTAECLVTRVSTDSLATCLSGNGAQLWLATDVPVSEESDALWVRLLAVAAALWSTETVKVDQAMGDRKRLGPCAATTKQKGANTADRPHRKVRFHCDPEVRRLQLDELKDLLGYLESLLTDEQRAKLEAGDKKPGAALKASSGEKDPEFTRAVEAANAIDVVKVYEFMGGDPKNPECPICKAQDKGVEVGGKVNCLKCHHASCKGKGGDKGFFPIALACVMRGQEPRGPAFAQAVRDLAEHFGTTPLPEGKGKRKRGHLRLVHSSAGNTDAEWVKSLTTTQAGDYKGSAENVITVLSHDSRWTGVPAYNEFSQRHVWLREPPWDPTERPASFEAEQEVSDSDDTRLVAWFARHYGMSCSPEVVSRGLTVVAEKHRFHPVREYLDAVAPTWDGKARAHYWLIDYLGVEDTEYARAMGSKWLISLVARIFQPGCKSDCVLLVKGDQGLKKSTALKILGGKWFSDSLSDVSSKDAMVDLAGVWILEWAELAGMSKSERNAVKRFISKWFDRYRPPYGKRVITQLRQCGFAATANDDETLTDPTGNRRWLPVDATKVDAAGLARDRDQIWAEVVQMYRDGLPWWITDDEQELLKAAKEAQEDERQVLPWEEMLQTRIPSTVNFVTGPEVLTDILGLAARDCQRGAQMSLADTMRGLGWSRGRITDGGYRVRGFVRPGLREVKGVLVDGQGRSVTASRYEPPVTTSRYEPPDYAPY